MIRERTPRTFVNKRNWQPPSTSPRGATRGLAGLTLAVCLASCATVRAESLPVSADAHIEGNAPDSNFGTSPVLSIAQTDLGGNKAYLQFDASTWGATNLGRVESLHLVWAGSTNITRTLYVCLITGAGANDWTEGALTWSNAPGNNVSGTARGFVAYPGQTVTPLGSVQYTMRSPRELTIPFSAGSAEGNALLSALNTGTRKATVGVGYNSSQSTTVGIYSKEYDGGMSAASLELSLSADPVPPMTDPQLFDRLDLDRPGLSAVKAAVATNNLTLAKAELAAYFRQRTGLFHYVDAHDPAKSVTNPAGALQGARPLVNRTGDFDAQYWNGDVFDWRRAPISYKERMYFFSTFGQAAAVETGNDVARALVNLVRSFAWQYHSPAAPGGDMWATMNTGIRMRSGWPTAFQCLLHSPAFTDEDILLFLKTVWDQTDYIYRNPSDTSNWLTFEMAGLYTSGVVYPEFRDAEAWRRLACETAMTDVNRGWLPDGMSIEKSASYGSFFSNYYVMYDLARFVGRLDEFNFISFPSLTERLFDAYLKLMTPDRRTPCLNDGGQAEVVNILSTGLEYFTNREDFRWIVSQGKEGTQPGFTSVAFPYAGYLVARSGWETNANYLMCDAGPVGYRHAHQDKLNLVVWAYGRQILFDSPQPGESDDWTYLNFLRDTFSHSTGLVDNRPQRRRWYSAPHPSQMPYQPLTDFAWEITETGAWAAGCFTNSYGRAGSMGNDSYPYKAGSNFYDGWGAPAGQFRQVAYIAPDIFVVQDWFVPNDTAGHTYEIRWQFNSTAVAVSGFRAQSTDSGQPNLAVIPLQTNDLTVAAVSAQLTPEVMGWRLVSGNIMPATTLRHARTGIGSRGFLTLLLPLRKGATADAVTFQDQSGVIALRIGDGREYSIHPAAGPGERLLVEDAGFSGDVLPVVRDAHIDGTSPASNFGAADVLAIGQTALGGHKAYLLFNASVLGARQAQRVAQLRVNWSASTSITRTLAFNLITGTNTATGKRANDWTETGLTWQNAPGNNVALSNREFAAFPGESVTPLGTAQYVAGNPRELNLPIAANSAAEAALLAALNTGDRKLTIGVSYNSSQSTTVGIYSKEREDGRWGATLWLVLTPASPSLRWRGFVDGQPVLELDGPRGASYTIMASTNLIDWSDVATQDVTVPPVLWTDQADPTAPQRYYRLRVQ